MHIVVVGMSHKTASVSLREHVSLSDESLEHVLTQLRGTRTIMESVVLSTCNRTEVYALVSSVRAGRDYVMTVLAETSGIDKPVLAPNLYCYQGEAAVTHAMRVTSGLDSVVIGETQVLGQMRSAFQTAFEMGNTGALFNRLFRSILQVGKRAQAETTVGQNSVSVSYAAVQLASKVLGGRKDATALVVGTGHMGKLALQYLHAQGIKNLVVANRNPEKANEIADEVGATVIPLSSVSDRLSNVDILISATRAPGYTVVLEDVTVAMNRRKRSMVMIDIAMPLDIDPRIEQCSNVFLYNVDDLEGVIQANVEERRRQSEFVHAMIDEAVCEFSNWLTEQEVVPLIAALRAKGESIQSDVMQSLLRKLPDMSERDRRILNKHTMSIVNQLLRDPIQNVKELALASGDTEYVHMLAQLFGIDASEMVTNTGEWSSSIAERSRVQEGFVELFQRLRGEVVDSELSGNRGLHSVLR